MLTESILSAYCNEHIFCGKTLYVRHLENSSFQCRLPRVLIWTRLWKKPQNIF